MPTTAQNLGKPMLGRYVLVREVARSNDVVWEGFDPQMKRTVAVKELNLGAHLAGQARRDRIERFHREARAAGAMSHPNIVTIYEVGEDAGRYFIAMEFLRGQTLRDRMGMGGALPLSEAIAVTSALCDALEYAHLRGVVHRDIKPDNVHLPGAGRVVLTDFGIARITEEDQLTVAGQVFGTPSYMSPEQIAGGAIDARSDLFSLGVLLYEMVTGHKPFTGDSVVTITYRIAHDPTPPAPGATPGVEMVIARALAKNPADRFASAGEMRAALQAAGQFGGAPRTGLTGAFPATYAPPPQATAQYGMQTRAGVAPGYGMAGSIPAPSQPTGYALPAQTPAPLSAFDGGERRPWAAWAMVLLLMTFLAIGGGWAVSSAYKNQRVQISYTQDQKAYQTALTQYQAGDYVQAVATFERLRSSPHGVTASNARQMAVSAYRSLGQAAQKNNDLASAETYFGKAVSLALPPDDAPAREELAAVQRARGTVGAAPAPAQGQGPLDGVIGASPAPPQSTVSPANEPGGVRGMSPQNPLAAVLGTPSPAPAPLTTNDFTSANNAAAREAEAFYRQGEAANARGDQAGALRLWTAAVSAGPGSPASLRAQARITQISNARDPLGGM